MYINAYLYNICIMYNEMRMLRTYTYTGQKHGACFMEVQTMHCYILGRGCWLLLRRFHCKLLATYFTMIQYTPVPHNIIIHDLLMVIH